MVTIFSYLLYSQWSGTWLCSSWRDHSSQGWLIPRVSKLLSSEHAFHMQTNQSTAHSCQLPPLELSVFEHYLLALMLPQGLVPEPVGIVHTGQSGLPIVKTTIKALAMLSCSLCVPADPGASLCGPMWCDMALHGVACLASWGLWVTNCLFNGSHHLMLASPYLNKNKIPGTF